MIDSNTPVAMEAAILLKVDDANTRREINRAAGTVSQQLGRVEQQAGKQVGRALSQTVSEVAGKMKEAADKVSAVLNVPLKFGLAAGGGAVAAFLRSNTAEATRFKARISEVQTALGGVGEKLLYNTRFGGRTAYEWAERLSKYLNSISTDQLQKAANIIKGIAITVAGLKAFSLGADLLKSGAEMTRVLGGLRAASGVDGISAAGFGAAGAGAGGIIAAGMSQGMAGSVGRDATTAILRQDPETWAAFQQQMRGNLGARGYAAAGAGFSGASAARMVGGRMFGAGAGVLAAGAGLALGFEGSNLARMARGGDRIGYREAWNAVQQEGLRYGTGTAMENGQFNIRGAALTNEQREAARAAVLRRAGMSTGGDIFGRNISNIADTASLMRQYGTADSQRVDDATYGDLKGRIPDMRKLADEASKVSEEMMKLRDAEKAGTATYEFYENMYAQALARSDTLRRAITDIERLGAAERRERASLEAERVTVLDDFLAADAQRVASRGRPREEFARSAAELTRQRDEQIAARDRTSLALGMAASQMPAFTATRLNEASNVNKDLEREQAEYLRELAEIERMKKQTEETWRSEDVEARRLMEERVRKIEEAVTGVGVGTPAP